MRIAELLIGYGLYLSLFTVVTIDSIFNPSFTFLSFELNLSYVYLLCVGVVLPVALIFLVIYLIRNNAPEGMYFKILRTVKQEE